MVIQINILLLTSSYAPRGLYGHFVGGLSIPPPEKKSKINVSFKKKIKKRFMVPSSKIVINLSRTHEKAEPKRFTD